MNKTYHGSCSCGRVRFEVGMDLDAGTFKCNCTVCWKKRFWGVFVKPETFRVVQGEAELSVFGEKRRHHFCRHCGVKIFGRGADGVRTVINLAALDDLDPKDLARAPVKYVDGLHDNFAAAPDVTSHL